MGSRKIDFEVEILSVVLTDGRVPENWTGTEAKVWRAETGAWLTRGGTQTSDVNTRVRSCYESSQFELGFLMIKMCN